MHKYEIIIYWSNEDGAFVAEAPELPGCAAHGDTQEAALGAHRPSNRPVARNGPGVWRPNSGAEG